MVWVQFLTWISLLTTEFTYFIEYYTCLGKPYCMKQLLIMVEMNPSHGCIFVEVFACLCDKVITVSD
jgi:hypothetical protein